MKSKLILLVLFLVLVISGCNDVMNYDKTILKQETIVGSCSLSSDATEYSIKATDKILLTIADCEGNEIYYNSKIQVQMYNDGEWDDVEYHGGPTEQLTGNRSSFGQLCYSYDKLRWRCAKRHI